MKGNEINKLLNLGARHSLYREDGKWYHNLKKFPGVLFDKDGYVVFENEESYSSNPELQRRKDLHIADGIKHLGSYKHFTDIQRKIILENQPVRSINYKNAEETVRTLREIDVILRNRGLVDKLKNRYKNTCQLCEIRLKIGRGKFYSEIHHIVPLGKPHNGTDNLENMICVCPNCHILLDFGTKLLDVNSFKIDNHPIKKKNIEYYNSKICRH